MTTMRRFGTITLLAAAVALAPSPSWGLDPVPGVVQHGQIGSGTGYLIDPAGVNDNFVFGLHSALSTGIQPLPLSFSAPAQSYGDGTSFGGGSMTITPYGGPGIVGGLQFGGLSLSDANSTGSAFDGLPLGSFIKGSASSLFVNSGTDTVTGSASSLSPIRGSSRPGATSRATSRRRSTSAATRPDISGSSSI